MSVTYTTAHHNAGPLTHWERPGIEPESLWMLVRFVSAEPPKVIHDLLAKLSSEELKAISKLKIFLDNRNT